MRVIEPCTLSTCIKSNTFSEDDIAELRNNFSQNQLKIIDQIVLKGVHRHSIMLLKEAQRKVQRELPLLKHGVFVAADLHKVSN